MVIMHLDDIDTGNCIWVFLNIVLCGRRKTPASPPPNHNSPNTTHHIAANRPPSQTTNSRTTHKMADSDFSAYYLQRAAKELAEDLDKVREARDFKPDSVQVLVHAIQQGSDSFPAADRAKVAAAAKPAADAGR